MNYRKLGRTGLEVSEVGLGTEYLNGQPRETVVSTIREAVSNRVNYFDVLFSFPEYLDNLSAGLDGLRERVIIAGHLGCAETDGQYRLSRDPQECGTNFLDMLSRLKTDRVDVLMLQNVDEEEDYRGLVGPGGLLELALRFRQEGKAAFLGLSGHTVPVPLEAVRSGCFDVIMFPANPACDAMPPEVLPWHEEGAPAREQRPGGPGARRSFYQTCAAEGVAVVGMKPFGGGRLLQEGEGGALTPVQCISYALSQPAVATVIPGAKNTEELRAALRYVTASDEERDFSSALVRSSWALKGSCCYCNHCLPCPSEINIGQVLRLLDSARQGVSDELRAQYRSLEATASACVECGECAERCPFGVDVIAGMQEAARALG